MPAMSERDAEFILRSLAIEALATCTVAGIDQATITAIPTHDHDGDWWKVAWYKGDQCMTASCSFDEGDDGE